jgi:hypothetical protein
MKKKMYLHKYVYINIYKKNITRAVFFNDSLEVEGYRSQKQKYNKHRDYNAILLDNKRLVQNRFQDFKDK